MTLATPSALGAIPQLADVDGAVPVDQGGGAGQVNRRLTFDDIDPAFAITSFARSGFSANPKELGDTIVDPAFTATYGATITNPLTITESQGPNVDAILLAAAAAFGYANGGGSGLPARTFVRTGINQTVSWTLSAKKDPAGPIAQWILSQQWQPRVFFGIATPAAFTEAFIEALPGASRLQSSFASSPTYLIGAGVAGQYGFLAWPTAFGNPTLFKDNTTGFVLPMTKVATAVAVTNAFAVLVGGGYDVWQTDSQVLSAVTILVVP